MNIVVLAEVDHRQTTTNPEVIHSLFWSTPAATLSDLSTGENLALVTDGDFTLQAESVAK